MGSLRRTYYWVVADYQGRPVIIGPKNSESEATEFGYQKLDVPFTVVELDTRNRASATAKIKAKRLDATGNLGESIQRAIHTVRET